MRRGIESWYVQLWSIRSIHVATVRTYDCSRNADSGVRDIGEALEELVAMVGADVDALRYVRVSEGSAMFSSPCI